jgi:nicotinate-nucleotide adenylyltransferase
MTVGLFFGSFNPIHIGHMAMANYLAEFCGLDEVWLVVSPHNPLKEKTSLLNNVDRLKMVNIAIGNDPRLRSCDLEFSLPQPSYTIDTLLEMKKKFPTYGFVLIIGSDQIPIFNQWKSYKEIEENYRRLIYPRPGFDVDASNIPLNAELINAPLLDLSSTQIRNWIREGKDVRHLVPAGVWKYITERGFYLS